MEGIVNVAWAEDEFKLEQFGEEVEREIRSEIGVECTGKVIEVVGTVIKVAGIDLTLGEMCELHIGRGKVLHAEVIGFTRQYALLSPFSSLQDISRSTRVIGLKRPLSILVGDALLGRVIDSLGMPIDGGQAIRSGMQRSVFALPPSPMIRRVIEAPLVTGVRAVDAMMTLGEGQRMGIFAPAGAGKSTLLGMFARGTKCDVNVIALIGERGREVREFVEIILGSLGMAKSIVICATSDRSPVERVKAAYVATTIAEYFRDQGQRVLLMMDSLTRFARACREIGLAAGEPPARRGFPPSVFAELPKLLERPGMGSTGSITALYTVLMEDESGNDPVAEEVRGILDGHIILSREIAVRNHYPAIDVLASLSRVMSQVVPGNHIDAAGRLRALLAKYKEVEMLLQIGDYHSGVNSFIDEAVEKYEAINAFLRQPVEQFSSIENTKTALMQLARR